MQHYGSLLRKWQLHSLTLSALMPCDLSIIIGQWSCDLPLIVDLWFIILAFASVQLTRTKVTIPCSAYVGFASKSKNASMWDHASGCKSIDMSPESSLSLTAPSAKWIAECLLISFRRKICVIPRREISVIFPWRQYVQWTCLQGLG